MPTRSLAAYANQARESRLDDAIALLTGGLVAVAVFLAVLAAAPASAAGRKAADDAGSTSAETPTLITLHRCVRADGGVSWQDRPCPADSRSASQREYAMPQPPVSVVRPAHGAQRASTHTRSPHPARAAVLPRKAPDACTQARRAREQAREAAGLRVDYALIERTDRAVWMACRGG